MLAPRMPLFSDQAKAPPLFEVDGGSRSRHGKYFLG